MRTIVYILCLLTFAAYGYSANTYYVDYTAGNDSDAGTLIAPWKNSPDMAGWSGGANPLSNGDTVIFKLGETWPAAALPIKPVVSGVTYEISESFGTGDYAIFDAENTDACVFAMDYYGSGACLNTTDANNISFSGIYAKNSTGHIVAESESNGASYSNCKFGYDSAHSGSMVYHLSGQALSFVDCYFDGSNLTSGYTIESSWAASGLIQGCTFLHAGSSYITYLSQNVDFVIEKNYFKRVSGTVSGLVWRNNYGAGVIRYNIFDNGGNNISGSHGLLKFWVAGTPSSAPGNKIYNNIFLSSGAKNSIAISSDATYTSPHYVRNNIFYHLSTAIVAPYGGDADFDYDYNDIYDVTTTASCGSATCTDGGHNITDDPSFTNASSIPDGLQLSSSESPCVNAGISYDSYSGTDYWGNTLVGNPDIGANEYTAGETPAAPTLTGMSSTGVTKN